MQNFKQFLSESTVSTEEVKRALSYYINDALLESPTEYATVKIGKHKIQNVAAAKPSVRPSTGGVLPYVDLELILTNGSKVNVGIRVAKGKKFLVYRGKKLRNAGVPALYNGIHSLDKMYPEVREHYLSTALDFYRGKGYEHGTDVPTVYGRITGDLKKKILLGDSKHGGVVDYIFAVDRAPLRYRKMRIPEIKKAFKGSEFVITIGNTRAFNASEVLSNNDVYVWSGKRHARLYLGNDRIDINNHPALFGPPEGSSKEYGTKKFRVGMNIDSKDIVDIKDNTRIFKLELKSPKELESPTNMLKPAGGSEPARLDSPPGRRSRISDQDAEADRKDYGEALSPDEREEIITKITDSFQRGMRHRFKRELERGQVDFIQRELEDIDDNNLRRMLSTPSHRLAVEIKAEYL